MSTNIPLSPIPAPAETTRIAIVTAEWNSHITTRLRDDAATRLMELGIDRKRIDLYSVPGTIELTYGARRCMDMGIYDAIIIFGVVLRGDTPHFDYVCQSVTQGMTALNLLGRTPVIFGVLTVDTEQQALDRIGGPAGNKGIEAAETALRMLPLRP